MPLEGHYFTVAPALAHLVRRWRPPPAAPWQAWVDDDARGRVRLTGLFHRVPGARSAVIVIHGLGGSITSHYCSRAAAAAEAAGLSCLRLSLRGSDKLGEDLGHAALTADVHAALASPEIQGHDRVHVLGFSLGGHLALCLAAEPHDARLRSVAASCTPIDLAVSSRAFDRDVAWPYRAHVLAALKRRYRAVARRHPVPTPVAVVDRIRTVHDWDRLTVVPRFGFADVADYHARASVLPRLAGLRVPALLVAAVHDPMVPEASLRVPLASVTTLDVRWTRRGGHVGFPKDLDLGVPGPRGFEEQVLAWFAGT